MTDRLTSQQDALAAYIRDPDRVAAPQGMEARRLKIYRDLFFNNLESLLSSNFPVIRKLYGEQRWRDLVRDFYRDHDCRTPLFTELGREFLRYLEIRIAAPESDLEPWLFELAHYEWVELALQISEASLNDVGYDPHGDMLDERPLLSPLAWPLAYLWPVHRIGPDYRPAAMPKAPTLLLLRREHDGQVSFHALTPLSFRLLQRLDEQPQLDGRGQLLALAAEAGAQDTDAFIRDGLALLEQMRHEGTILGTRTDAAQAV